MVYIRTKRELSDRNKQRQKRWDSPDIPEGTEFLVFDSWNRFKFTTLRYMNYEYNVKVSDLELVPKSND